MIHLFHKHKRSIYSLIFTYVVEEMSLKKSESGA
jgi:hypothetical protein